MYKLVNLWLRKVYFFVFLFGVTGFGDGAVLTVTNTADSGAGSLRQAILDAAAGDTIDIISTGTITLVSFLPRIEKNLTIKGSGAEHLTIDGQMLTGVFLISGNCTVSIQKLTIFQGDNQIDGGGGIYINGSNVTLQDCIIDSCRSIGPGGGIYAIHASLTMQGCTISNNSAVHQYWSMGGGYIWSDPHICVWLIVISRITPHAMEAVVYVFTHPTVPSIFQTVQ